MAHPNTPSHPTHPSIIDTITHIVEEGKHIIDGIMPVVKEVEHIIVEATPVAKEVIKVAKKEKEPANDIGHDLHVIKDEIVAGIRELETKIHEVVHPHN